MRTIAPEKQHSAQGPGRSAGRAAAAISALTLLLLASASPATGAVDTEVESYLDMSLEDLLSLEVTTVAKKSQSVADTAAAVFVITGEDIRRSGATSVPELLRMVPGFQVNRIDANSWSITSRGFNGVFANKLLVLIDGRTVYTPSFSGVYWDVQDTMLEDVERIEVVRGPGGTLWGANAVNGVVNVITKHAADTHGGLASVRAGNEERGTVSLRFGGQLDDRIDGRVFAKYVDRDGTKRLADGEDAGDDWDAGRIGFRLDGQLQARHRWTLQGEAYHQNYDQQVRVFQTTPPFAVTGPDASEASGWHLLARWEGDFDTAGTARLQLYHDHNDRDEAYFGQTYDTTDLDFQHQLPVGEASEVIWGLGYRYIDDDFDNTFTVQVDPESRSEDIWSGFVQAEMPLIADRVRLTLGSKFEDNDYTGFEYQPSARLLWKPDARQSVWGAVSRAVRTPSRVETTGRVVTAVVPIPPPPGYAEISLDGNQDFDAEDLIAYEVGYRFSNGRAFSLDAAAFVNQYDNLVTTDVTPTGIQFGNRASADSHGIELAADWRPLSWWRLQAGYTWFELDMDLDADSTDPYNPDLTEKSSPEDQWSLRSSMDLGQHWELDLWAYHSSSIPVASRGALLQNLSIDAYTSLNARIAWRPSDDLELSLVGQNLLDPVHPETVDEGLTPPAEIERSVYAQVRVKF